MSDKFDLEATAQRIRHMGEHVYLCERTSYTEMCDVFFVDFPALIGRVEELEAEVAELLPDAKLGRALRGMPKGQWLIHTDTVVLPEHWIRRDWRYLHGEGLRPEAALGVEAAP